MAPIRVLLVDDHDVVRQGLRAIISSQPDIEVVGEAATGEEGLRRVGFDQPHVVVLDVRLPDTSGVEVCREIRQRFPDVRVLMFTSFADEDALMAATLAGASGYTLKRIRTDELIDNIRRVAAGESLLDPESIAALRKRIGSDRTDDPLLSLLSARERTILNHVAQGLTNRQIAETLHLAEKTVKNHVSNLLTKMGMSRRTEAAAHLVRVTATDAYPPEEWPNSR